MPPSEFPARTHYQNPAVAQRYDEEHVGSWRLRLIRKRELRALERVTKDMPRKSRVLDLPCGTGQLLRPLIDRFAHVCGLDVSPDMLEVARDRWAGAHNVRFVSGDATCLPFGDGEFDCVFSVRFFGHTPPDVRLAALSEIARVSKGRVALMMYARGPLVSLSKRIQRLIHPSSIPWYPIRSRRELRDIFREAGLVIGSARRLLPVLSETVMVIANKF